MQKPPVLKADMQKCHEKGSTEALGGGRRSDSLFPTGLALVKAKKERPQRPQVFGDQLRRYPSTCVAFLQHSEATGRCFVSSKQAHQNHNSGFFSPRS